MKLAKKGLMVSSFFLTGCGWSVTSFLPANQIGQYLLLLVSDVHGYVGYLYQQLGLAERLGYVVNGTGEQSHQTVAVSITGRDKEDREYGGYRATGSTPFPIQYHSSPASHITQNEVGHNALRHRHGGLSVSAVSTLT